MLGFSFFCYIKMSFLQESEVQSSDDIPILWLLMRLADTKVSSPSIHMVILTQYALVHKCKPTSGEMEETGIYVSQPTEHQCSLRNTNAFCFKGYSRQHHGWHSPFPEVG